ncbi:MAG: hypothetical protein WD823_01500 [Sulfuricaulis sp.]|uniref:hypothetical protein n=1 Tax=Sulfuricaulis sp. TaxID=2003553 RepID=UPI0034A2A27D
MVDKPWSDKKLTKGQIEQRLESLRCKFIKEHFPGSALWQVPTGQYFSVSYDDCAVEEARTKS